MLRVVDSGDITYMYTPLEMHDEVISTVPMHLKTMQGSIKNFKYSQEYIALNKSPKLRSLSARNARLFNFNNYEDEEEYRISLEKLLEILPGNKSRLFFGGDFVSLKELSTVIEIAGNIKYKTWVIASGDRSLLNNYSLNLLCSDSSLPDNVWLYELKAEEENDCLLHDFPLLSYELSDQLDCELSQFPSEYKSFSINVCKNQ